MHSRFRFESRVKVLEASEGGSSRQVQEGSKYITRIVGIFDHTAVILNSVAH